jgi:hypothetical protein
VPGQSASTQFQRLRDEAGWDRDDDENDRAWMSYRTALVRQFNTTYSVDEDDLAAWHDLLRHIGINNPPPEVAECKKVSFMVKRLAKRTSRLTLPYLSSL